MTSSDDPLTGPDVDAWTALEHASIPTLLMCVAQISGDDRWLEPPFRPKRDTAFFADDTGGLPAPVQQEIRKAAGTLLSELAEGQRTLPPVIDRERIGRMLSVCVGEEVPPEYTGLALEEMGLADRAVGWHDGLRPPTTDDYEVLIIGAGISGISAAIRLDELGIPYQIVERNSDLGGTWLENRYPDCGVDTPNHLYCFSFAPNDEWGAYFSKRREIWEYLHRVAAERGVLDRIRFETEVRSLRWNGKEQHWDAQLCSGDETFELLPRAVISAVGQLNRPKIPEIPGLSTFTGTWFHSARWAEDVDLTGKRVAVVGVGASAMQLLRTVGEQADHLVVYQRSPQWVREDPSYHLTVSPETKWLMRNVPYYLGWYRFGLFWRASDGLLATLRRDPDWPHPERAMGRVNDRHREVLTQYLLDALEGRPDLVEKTLPTYPPFGKRMLIDNGWFTTLRRSNVSLVAASVERIDGSELVGSDGSRHEVDVIIFATGFEAGQMLSSMEIVGRSGETIEEQWGDDDPRAFLGITVPGFPNLFCLFGPNTNVAHGGSVIFQVECQIRYVTGCLREMIERGLQSMEVRREVHDEYNRRVDAEHDQLVWAHPGLDSWYRNSKGRVFSPMPWRLVDYWQMTREPDLSDYLVHT